MTTKLSDDEINSLRAMLLSPDVTTVELARFVIDEHVIDGPALDKLYDIVVECSKIQTEKINELKQSRAQYLDDQLTIVSYNDETEKEKQLRACLNILSWALMDIGIARSMDVIHLKNL